MTKTKKLSIYSLGIALYVALALCIQFPIFENYYLCLGYVVMAVYCYFFGPLAGMTVGFFGVVFYCLLMSGLRGMPGWSIGNLVIGFAVGFTCKAVKSMKNKHFKHILIGIVMIISTAFAMIVVKSGIESFLYLQPMLIRVANNLYAFVADSMVLIAALPLCVVLEPTINRLFPKIEKK